MDKNDRWLRAMRRATAAAYCDMSAPKFLREVACGRLPDPFMLDGWEHWDRSAIDKSLDRLAGYTYDWRKDQPGLRPPGNSCDELLG